MDFESAKDDFALLLLRKGLVVFEARKIEVDSQLKVMFYPSDRLKTSSRQIRVQYKDGRESADQPINDALPLAYDKLMSIFQKEFSPSGLDGTLYKEAVVNALIHSDYGENCPLIT
jgi:hypothetical protein